MPAGERATLGSVLSIGPGAAQAGAQAALAEFARRITPVDDIEQALSLLEQSQPELVIVRESVPGGEAMALLQRCRKNWPTLPVVVLDDKPDVNLAVQFVRAGAYDYVRSPLDRQALGALVRGMEMERSLRAPARSRFFLGECPTGLPIVGKSPAMQRTFETLRLVADSRCNPVLVLGETGSGKELAARAVHAWRCGSGQELVAVNCAALTATLLESELFGHVKGAFTGADRDKVGLFELAGEGSLFLDEISETAPELQAKLLRVLQERTFRKVGGTRDIACNATIIASSNCNLLEHARSGRFRQDLYYRLAVFPVTVPPLRDPSRRADIALLAEYFLENSSIPKAADIASFAPSAMERLAAHDWPGNVRELKNVIERAIILERSNQITAQSVVLDHNLGACVAAPPSVSEHRAQAPSNAAPAESAVAAPAVASPAASGTCSVPSAGASKGMDFSLETAEREFILRALKETGWQRTRAAALLGITRATLHAKLKRYDIRLPGATETQSAAGQDTPVPAER